MNYAYMLLCEGGSYYCGWTNDLAKRFQCHVSGKGGKYTRSHRPLELAYYEEFDTKEAAMAREWHLKRLSHGEKAELAERFKKIPTTGGNI